MMMLMGFYRAELKFENTCVYWPPFFFRFNPSGTRQTTRLQSKLPDEKGGRSSGNSLLKRNSPSMLLGSGLPQ